MSRAAPDPQRWRQLAAIFDQVVEHPEPEHEALLESLCGGDPELRDEVAAMLRASEGSEPRVPTVALEGFLAAEPGVGAGNCLGPYRLEREVGRGGMGVVFAARDTRIGRRVAIKVLHRPSDSTSGPANSLAASRALREARAASALDHPNLCTLLDLGETASGYPFLVMVFYEGETLAQRIARGPLSPAEARDLVRQLASGLERAHEAGIVHRDLKPANLLVTSRGELKILDFGVAKLRREESLTRAGESPGTPAYMAPEQVEGEGVDHRTDLWAVGVVLFEMLTGHRLFAADHPQAVLHQIRAADRDLLDRIPADCPADLRRVLEKTLTRNPADRYPSAGELLADLRGDTPRRGDAPADPWRRRALMLAIASMVALVAAGGWRLVTTNRSTPESTTGGWHLPGGTSNDGLRAPASARLPAPERAAADERPRLAVLPFRNLGGVEELQWMRNGIAELLATDLSQSAELDLLSPARVARVLSAAELDEDELAAWAEREEIEILVRGAFARAGPTLRLVLSVEEAHSGRVLASRQVEGREEQIFSFVDELAAAVRRGFQIEPTPGAEPVHEVTTASMDAWRLYSEAIDLYRRGKRTEALALLEKAVEIDSGFALAWSSLGRLHKNLGNLEEARRCSTRAVELAERLPLSRRHEIVGAHHGTRWSTQPLAIDAYRAAIRHNPYRETPRNNLAKIYADRELYAEAIGEYRALLALGTRFPGTTTALANARAGLGQFETAHRLLLDLAERHGGNWSVQMQLGWLHTEWGRLDEALSHLERAEALRPGEPFLHYARWRVHTLREDWAAAETAARALGARPEPWEQWRGAVSLAKIRLFQGRDSEALEAFGRALVVPGSAPGFIALSRCWKAALLRHLGDFEGAYRESLRARAEAEGDWPELEAIFEGALALQSLGREVEVETLVEELESRAVADPNPVQQRQVWLLRGLLALARGEPEPALGALTRAEELLPPRGVEFHWYVYPQHGTVWSAFGRAHLALGDPESAKPWLRLAASSGSERLESPLPYRESRRILGTLTP